MVVRLPALGPQPLPPFTRRHLPGLGLTRHELDALLASGSVVEPVRGAYLDARCAADPVSRARAVALVLPPGAAVARRTAAWLYGIDPRGPDERDGVDPVECVVAAGAVVPHRAGLVAREARLGVEDVACVHGTPVTTAERTALDLARFLRPFMGLAVVDAFAHARLVDPLRLVGRIEDFTGGRGIEQARRLVRFCDAATESYGESWLRLRIVDAGFPRPEAQIWICDPAGIAVYRLDMGWRERRLAIEYDGEEFHSRPEHRKRDIQRRQALADTYGWTVVGVGKGEVLGRSMELERGLGDLLGLEAAIRRRAW